LIAQLTLQKQQLEAAIQNEKNLLRFECDGNQVLIARYSNFYMSAAERRMRTSGRGRGRGAWRGRGGLNYGYPY